MKYGQNVKKKVSTAPSTTRVSWVKAAMAGAILIGAAAGCEQDGDPRAEIGGHQRAATTRSRTPSVQDAPGALLAKYRMYWPTRSQEEVADRTTKVATVLRQKQVHLLSPSPVLRDSAKPFDDDKVLVSYDADYDTLWVRDEDLLMAEGSSADIGEEKARSAMKSVFDDLVAAGLLDSRHYDPSDVQTGHHRLSFGMRGSPTIRESVVEYRFRMLRKLNGLDVPNNGILIGIAPSGQRSSIKIGGVQVESTDNGVDELPVLSGGVVTRNVSTEDLQKRFEKEVRAGTKKHVGWKRLMYVMPEGAREAVVEPSMVYRFACVGADAQGAEYVEPAQLYSFSVVDPSKPAVNLFPARP
jgi:hypothetical protein